MACLGFEDEGEGAAVVMIHGLGGSANCFQPQIPHLTKGFRVIRPDLPGVGRSAAAASATIHSAVDALVTILDQLHIESAHWVGHSLGSVICQVAAARHNPRVQSLTLLGPITEVTQAGRFGLRDRAEKVRLQGLGGIVDTYIQNSLARDISERNPAAIAYLRESLLRQSPQRYREFCMDLADHEAVMLTEIVTPTLILTGDQDRAATVEQAAALKNKLKNATLFILESCGHWCTIERPVEVTLAISRHLEALTRPEQAKR